ncbi:MAG TPA: RNA-binding S4 domain-containing protein [Thermoanaerobaculia bacterium]|nr:RNA-binding S4 domain-containing protein [Thermoanaerobaculia bacterium]
MTRRDKLASVTVRLDKWLQVARAFKTRSKATKACSLGRVRINGARAKPHRPVAVGDRVEFAQGEWERIWIVRELHDRPLPKAEVPRLYEDESPPRPEPKPEERWLHRPPVVREKGSGRPTKRDRRRLERLRSE